MAPIMTSVETRERAARTDFARRIIVADTIPPVTDQTSASGPRAWLIDHRAEIKFLTVFLVLLVGSFSFLAWKPINDNVVEPFTSVVAKVSGASLDLIGQDVRMRGTIIESKRFAVNIRNGCNGVETLVIFASAVLAFPAPWRSRAIGLVLGFLAIQFVNLVRVVALFLTGAFYPDWFDSSHTVIWQTVVILFGVLLWIFWAHRFAGPVPGSPGAAGEATA